MKPGSLPLPLIKALAHLDRFLGALEISLGSWALAGLLLLTLASVLTLTAHFDPIARAVLPEARGRANIPPPEVTTPAVNIQTGTPELPFFILTRTEPPESGLNPTNPSPPLITPPLAVEEAHVK